MFSAQPASLYVAALVASTFCVLDSVLGTYWPSTMQVSPPSFCNNLMKKGADQEQLSHLLNAAVLEEAAAHNK